MKTCCFRKCLCLLFLGSFLSWARAFSRFASSTHLSSRIPACRWSTRLQQQQDKLNQSDSKPEAEPTYYSPNVALDESRYRYNIDDESTREQQQRSSSINEYSFFDEATILVKAGSGGQGASTHKKGVNNQNGPPDGGNGGKGGNVILEIDDSLNTLAGLSQAWRPNSFGGASSTKSVVRPKSFRAENGANGGRQFKNGKFGKDVVIRVPPGTVVQQEFDNDNNETQLIDVGTLTYEQPTLVVAQGGQGGEGSGVAGKISGRGVRRPRVPPEGGERKRLKLTLKIVADVALVGVPNCGKSTFLAAVTRAKPKIANYPFTTVVPNLGVWIPPAEFENSGSSQSSEGAGSSGLVLCVSRAFHLSQSSSSAAQRLTHLYHITVLGCPGLIAGAAQGVGLGHAFLRHVERCHVILHLIDATSNDPIADFEMLNREISNYGSGELARMPQVVVVNKVDAFDGDGSSGEEWEEGLTTRLSRDELEQKLKESMSHSRLMWMSAKEKEGVDELMTRMAGFVRKVKDVK